MTVNLLHAIGVLALFVLLPWFCYRSKRWPTWKQYFTYEKECIFHRWYYLPKPKAYTKTPDPNFRRCLKCKREQYKVYLDSGLLSGWLNMGGK